MMNKFFSVLGLMMMASGIPTLAQNVGVGYKADGSDVSGDFAEAEGDGASVSADVTVGFNIGKKIAIALVQPNGSFTNDPLFHPTTGNFDPNNLWTSIYFIDNLSKTPANSSTWNNVTSHRLQVSGGIYSNTDVTLTVAPSLDFVNEDDPSSKVRGRFLFDISDSHASGRASYINQGDGNTSTTSIFPATVNIGVDTFAANGGVLSFYIASNFYVDTIDATDRSGNYYSTMTITMTAM